MSYNHGIDMRVLVNGRPTREYSHKGMSFIESRHGTNYSIRLKNDNSFKVMAVLSVDGLDVITGKAAEESNKGYILDPYSNVEIKGYRISDQNSAAFIFTSKGKSYVKSATGDARNSGVIGVRVFKEKYKAPAPQPTVNGTNGVGSVTICANYVSSGLNSLGTSTNSSTQTYSANMSAPKAASKGAGGQSCGGVLRSMSTANSFDAPISYNQFDTGTGWGKKLDDKVKKEYFDKGDLLTEIVTFYASKTALVDMGLDLDEDPRVSEEPQMPKAFKSKYCEPPKGWVG